MATLNQLLTRLVELQKQGHGDLEVYAQNSSSGAVDILTSYATITDKPDNETGPFDMEGKQWIIISSGY